MCRLHEKFKFYKSVAIADSMGKTKFDSNGKSISSVAPLVEFDKTPPSTLEDVFVIEDKSPPTEIIDDMDMEDADADDQ